MLEHRNMGSQIYVVDNLEQFLQRISLGMILKGRIVDILDENKYILRIWGYNIVMDSEYQFNLKDEVELVVEGVKPHLILNLRKKRKNIIIPEEGIADITVD